MSVFFERSRVWTIERHGSVAVETEFIGGLAKLGVVLRTMYVVAIEAGDSASVHDALHEIIALHSVLMSGAIREVRECGLTEFVFFERPKVCQLESYTITHRPIKVRALNRSGEWAAL